MTLAALAASAVLGYSSVPELAKTKVIDATILKNGTAVLIHQVEVPSSGEVLIEEPPLAALGTLWIYGHQGSQISSVVMTKWTKESDTTISVGSVAEAMALNVGKTMDIRIFDNKEWKDVKGKVVSVNQQLVVFEEASTGQNMFVPLTSIGSFKGGNDLVWTRVVKTTEEKPVLRITAKPGTRVNLMGLQSGMNWVPAYQVDISDSKNMKMVAKATLVNDLADLDGVEARLVTGFPNFTSLGQWDPLTYVSMMLGRGGTPGGGGGFAGSQAAPMQNTAGFRREATDEAYESFVPQTGEGFSGEDLFFTPLKNVKLKSGERGYYVLFQTESSFSHVYTLNLPESTASTGSRDYMRNELTVWHEIEFLNGMKQPWTTGTALIMQNGQMLGMDELKYTTPGTKAYLKVAKALDVAAELKEEEVERERGALKDRYGNISHDLVTVRGTLDLTNYKGSEIDFKTSKQVEGEVIGAEGSTRTFKSALRLNQINPTSVIEWRIQLKKGESKKLTYTYKVYVAAR